MTGKLRRIEEIEALGERLGISIGDIELYDRALTHASTASEAGEPVNDYESLEFLGDAALGLAIAHHLYDSIPGRTPGEYSRMRATLVNRRCVAHVAKRLDIAPVIRLGKGEELSGGRQRTALLADCLEALIGAIYLDKGWNTAREFIIEVFSDEIDRIDELDSVWDFKSRLQHYCQSERIPLPVFVVEKAEGPDHKKEFEVAVQVRGEFAGRGTGTSKKEAEQNAARMALDHEGIHFG